MGKHLRFSTQLTAATLLLLSACAPTTGGKSLTTGAKVHIDWDTLHYHFPAARALNAKATRQEEYKVAEEVPLIFIYDNDCLQDQKRRPFDFFPVNARFTEPSTELRLQAYPYATKRALNVKELTSLADEDACLSDISNELPLQANAVNDPRVPEQLHLAAIRAVQGWDLLLGSPPRAMPKVTVAIVDTGVDYNHDDFRSQMWMNAQGFFGFDFVNLDNQPLDDNSHGTHVAGLAAAAWNNGIGVAGVGGPTVRIMSVKVLDQSALGSSANAINGINYAVRNGAQVINLSLSGYGRSAAWETALTNAAAAGVTVVVAAGNNAARLDATNWVTPASYARGIAGVIAVGAIDAVTSGRSGFSNWGPDYVDLGAPGSNGILSTIPGQAYSTKQGTSMASPIVAGGVAIIYSYNKLVRGVFPTAAVAESTLVNAAVKKENLNLFFSQGRIFDLYSLVAALKGTTPPPANPPPTTPPPTGSGFKLVDAATDTVTRALNSSDSVRYTGVEHINIRYDSTSAISGVNFYVDGVFTRSELSSPFCLAGKRAGGDYMDWIPTVGTHVIRAVPLILQNSVWVEQPALQMNLQVTN